MYDPIHGQITFPKLMWDIIDTPQFQRLRRLRQLASSYFIVIGNNHTRFEHCFGTGFLAQDLITRCFNIFKEDDIDKNDIDNYIKCVSIAGLCHDIGHGPFSHAFNAVLEQLGIKDWEHEKFGGEIIKYLIEDNQIKDINDDMLEMINELIEGKSSSQNTNNYKWISPIV